MMPIFKADRRREFRLQKVISPHPDLEEELVIGAEPIEEDYLVVMVDIGTNQVFMINLDSVAKWPITVPYDDLLACIDDGVILLSDLGLDPRVLMDESFLTEGFKRKAEKRYEAILPLILNVEETLRNSYGDELISKAAADAGCTTQYIYNCFYSWLRHGCRKMGLGMPQGKNANHIPKQRNIRVKQGAPNQDIPRGKVLDEFDYKTFEVGRRLYQRKNGPVIYKTIRILWRKYYLKNSIRLTAAERHRTGEKFELELLKPDERPSYWQFYYWLKKYYGGSLPKRDRSRKNATEYAANNKGRPGDAFVHVVAPGEIYQLDETPFDEEVVSIFDPTRRTKVGKATLYFVRDTFSWSIAGIYITTQSPSYATAKEALFNAIRDKKGFLEEIGCPLNPDLWPIKGAPLALLVDKAEFHNKLSEGPISDIPITIKFTRSGRGDDKGHIETLFIVFSNFFKGLSAAHQTKSLRDIALKIARKNACLTINELYIIAAVYAVHFNSKRLPDRYPLTRSMVQDGVPPIPNKLFEWGMKNRPGALIEMDESEVYLKLLEKGEVSVHRTHVYLKNKQLHYNCAWTLEEGHQDRKRAGNKAKVFPCRYFRGLVDTIFLCTPDGLKIATLDAQDQRYSGLSFPEVDHQKKLERTQNALLGESELNSLVSAELFLEDMLQNARTQKVSSSVPSIAKIKDNRGYESVFDRIQQANRYVTAVRNEYESPFFDESNELQCDGDTTKTPTEPHNSVMNELDDNDEYDEFYSEDGEA